VPSILLFDVDVDVDFDFDFLLFSSRTTTPAGNPAKYRLARAMEAE